VHKHVTESHSVKTLLQ